MNQLRHMSVFAHVVEQGSITAAAETLQLSKSVVSQHLKTLEAELGLTLLKRTTRKQLLTPAGHAFYERCRELNMIADQAWQQAKDTKQVPQGRVKITAPHALMDAVVVPAIAAVMKCYSKVTPELISHDAHLNLSTDDIDLAIRVGTSETSTLKQRRIGEFRDVLCVNSSLLEQSEPSEIAYIAQGWQQQNIKHQFQHKADESAFVYEAEAQAVTHAFNASQALICNGAGMGLMPDFLFKLQQGELSEVFAEYQLPLNKVYALHPYSSHLPLSVAVCMEAVEKELSVCGLV